MNKRMAVLLIVTALMMLSACGAPETIRITDDAVGAIFVNDEEALVEEEI